MTHEERQCWETMRRALLMQVAAIDKLLNQVESPCEPRSGPVRNDQKPAPAAFDNEVAACIPTSTY